MKFLIVLLLLDSVSAFALTTPTEFKQRDVVSQGKLSTVYKRGLPLPRGGLSRRSGGASSSKNPPSGSPRGGLQRSASSGSLPSRSSRIASLEMTPSGGSHSGRQASSQQGTPNVAGPPSRSTGIGPSQLPQSASPRVQTGGPNQANPRGGPARRPQQAPMTPDLINAIGQSAGSATQWVHNHPATTALGCVGLAGCAVTGAGIGVLATGSGLASSVNGVATFGAGALALAAGSAATVAYQRESERNAATRPNNNGHSEMMQAPIMVNAPPMRAPAIGQMDRSANEASISRSAAAASRMSNLRQVASSGSLNAPRQGPARPPREMEMTQMGRSQ